MTGPGEPSVLVIGDVNTDVVALPAGAPAPGSDRPASISVRGGGAGANVAVHLARAGLDVSLAGCVGDDSPGGGLAAELAREGVRTALRVVPGVATGTIVSLVEPDGQRSMLADRGANLRLRPGDLPGAPRGGHVHLSGYTLLDPGPRAAGLAALAAGRAAGCTLSVDPASCAPLAAYGVDRWLADTAGITVLLPNADEARLLTGCADVAAAARALAGRHPVVAVTLGADGALWACGTEVAHRPAHPVRVLDTTGAGDAFTAGFLAAWLRSAGSEGAGAAAEAQDGVLDLALDAGLRTAAAVVARPGAR